jgi:hypothetical protein
MKTQIQHHVSRRAFCGIHTGPTPTLKIVYRHFMATMHRNALRGL